MGRRVREPGPLRGAPRAVSRRPEAVARRARARRRVVVGPDPGPAAPPRRAGEGGRFLLRRPCRRVWPDLELGHDPGDAGDAPGRLLDLAGDLLAGDHPAEEDLAGRVDRDLDVPLGGRRVERVAGARRRRRRRIRRRPPRVVARRRGTGSGTRPDCGAAGPAHWGNRRGVRARPRPAPFGPGVGPSIGRRHHGGKLTSGGTMPKNGSSSRPKSGWG